MFEVLRELSLKQDRLVEAAFQHFQRLLDGFVRVHNREARLFAARERQQLFGQRRAAMGTGFRRFEVSVRRALRIGALFDITGAPEDGREHVVEIVCDAAGQRPDGFDLLDLHEVAVEFLGLHSAGDDVGDGLHLGRE